MSPVMHLCQKFLKSLLVSGNSVIDKSLVNEKKMTNDDEENEDDEEDEFDEKLYQRRQQLKITNGNTKENPQSAAEILDKKLADISRRKPTLAINI